MRLYLFVFILMATLLFSAYSVETYVFTGTGADSKASNPDNWQGGVVPPSNFAGTPYNIVIEAGGMSKMDWDLPGRMYVKNIEFKNPGADGLEVEGTGEYSELVFSDETGIAGWSEVKCSGDIQKPVKINIPMKAGLSGNQGIEFTQDTTVMKDNPAFELWGSKLNFEKMSIRDGVRVNFMQEPFDDLKDLFVVGGWADVSAQSEQAPAQSMGDDIILKSTENNAAVISYYYEEDDPVTGGSEATISQDPESNSLKPCEIKVNNLGRTTSSRFEAARVQMYNTLWVSLLTEHAGDKATVRNLMCMNDDKSKLVIDWDGGDFFQVDNTGGRTDVDVNAGTFQFGKDHCFDPASVFSVYDEGVIRLLRAQDQRFRALQGNGKLQMDEVSTLYLNNRDEQQDGDFWFAGLIESENNLANIIISGDGTYGQGFSGKESEFNGKWIVNGAGKLMIGADCWKDQPGPLGNGSEIEVVSNSGSYKYAPTIRFDNSKQQHIFFEKDIIQTPSGFDPATTLEFGLPSSMALYPWSVSLLGDKLDLYMDTLLKGYSPAGVNGFVALQRDIGASGSIFFQGEGDGKVVFILEKEILMTGSDSIIIIDNCEVKIDRDNVFPALFALLAYANGTLDLNNFKTVLKGFMGDGKVNLGSPPGGIYSMSGATLDDSPPSGTLEVQYGDFKGGIMGHGTLILNGGKYSSLDLDGLSSYTGHTIVKQGWLYGKHPRAFGHSHIKIEPEGRCGPEGVMIENEFDVHGYLFSKGADAGVSTATLHSGGELGPGQSYSGEMMIRDLILKGDTHYWWTLDSWGKDGITILDTITLDENSTLTIHLTNRGADPAYYPHFDLFQFKNPEGVNLEGKIVIDYGETGWENDAQVAVMEDRIRLTLSRIPKSTGWSVY